MFSITLHSNLTAFKVANAVQNIGCPTGIPGSESLKFVIG
jgi:hypothetical protein